MRTPPLLADFSHARPCKPFCENSLTLPGVGELIGRSAADTENGCDVIHGVCSDLGRSFFVGCVGAH